MIYVGSRHFFLKGLSRHPLFVPFNPLTFGNYQLLFKLKDSKQWLFDWTTHASSHKCYHLFVASTMPMKHWIF